MEARMVDTRAARAIASAKGTTEARTATVATVAVATAAAREAAARVAMTEVVPAGREAVVVVAMATPQRSIASSKRA